MCDEHIKLVHAGGRTLHSPEIWKEDRYSLYEFKEMAIWNTTHNVDHGYTRDVVVINRNGQQHIIKFKFCCHEPEAVTLVRNGLWPSSPKEPQAAFEMNFMEQIKYLFLECRVSLKSICQAMQWAIPTLAQVYIKDIYRLLVGDSFAEYRFLLHMLNIFGNKNPLLGNDVQCPACPKENGNIYVSMDALFGCVRKMSAGTSCRPANHDETLFIKQDKVDSFLKSYNTKSSSKAQEPCHNFQAGSNLRSKTKSKKLDETAIFGAGCRHEIPLKFFSLKRGEEIGNAVYLLKWIKQSTENQNVTIYLFYDIACTLESHLKKTSQEELLHNVKVAIPTFHCYGHKVSCQVTYSGRRLDGFGLSDGEVMERMWSFLRPTAKITKEMTPSHRIDAMTDFLLHYGRKSVAQIGERLCDHMKKALHTKTDAEDQLNLQ